MTQDDNWVYANKIVKINTVGHTKNASHTTVYLFSLLTRFKLNVYLVLNFFFQFYLSQFHLVQLPIRNQ